MTVSHQLYRQIVQQLVRPARRTVDLDRPSLLPTASGQDSWDPDVSGAAIEARLAELPARQTVFCVAVAAAESLQWWEIWGSRRRMRPDDLEVPRLTIRWLERWALGEAFEEEIDALVFPLQSALDRFDLIAEEADMDFEGDLPRFRGIALAAHQTGLTLLHGLGFRALRGDRDIAALCVDGFANAMVYRGNHPTPEAARCEFLTRWWNRCVGRLAFRDAKTASI